MVFSSLEFIFRFLPIFLILYYLVPNSYKNLILFIGSVCFYTLGEPRFILLMLVSIVANYQFAIQIAKQNIPIPEKRNEDIYNNSNKKRNIRKNKDYKMGSNRKKRLWLFFALSYDFGILIYFKYWNFIIENINLLLKKTTHFSGFPLINLALPLGISFYTFQIVSYILDVYKGKIREARTLFNLAVYVSMFPQLISGPLIGYSDMKGQLKNREYSLGQFESGLKLFIIGLAFKVLIANRISILWNDIQTIGFESISTPLAWLGAVGYSLQLYFDFHGYTLMAIGVGKMLGFKLPENFSHPYISKSVTEFWRRWHMTLGNWFKNYVYIPLGGNRKGTMRLLFNLFIVWMFTGLWHGASWNYVIWGLSLFIMISIEKLFLKPILERSKIISRVYLLTVISMTWMIFAINSISDMKIYFGRLLAIVPAVNVNTYDYIKYFLTYKWILLFGIFFSMPFAKRWYNRYENSIPVNILLFLIFWYSVYQLANGINNPFLYFKF